jgi:ribosomal protein S18 acetylase RimI-like enzyme
MGKEMEMKRIVRSANLEDHNKIQSFLSRKKLFLHRHLDWRTPLDWLGSSPFLILEKKGLIEAVFVCPPDVHGIFWIRLFAVRSISSMDDDFSKLLRTAMNQIQEKSSEGVIASIGFLDWMKHLLLQNGFSTYQEVIQLKWNPNHQETAVPSLLDGAIIRNMKSGEIDEVTKIDQTCFDRIWMHSLPAVEKAYQQSAYATVAIFEGKMAGFQISTKFKNHAHIARLAVLPDFQKQGIGTALINNVLGHFKKPWVREITVNTQQDNDRSLRLYKKLGFCLTGESFPILVFRL